MSGIIYFGIEKMGLDALQALHEAEKDIRCVYTLVEEKRESIIAFEPFDEFCSARAINLRKIETANAANIIREIKAYRPDLIYIVGWSELICKQILDIPPHGCIGFHGTLLPRHRGRAPVPWSIIFGLRKTGMSMFYLRPGVDNGLLIDQDGYPIHKTDYACDVYEKACRSICGLIKKNHKKIVMRSITPSQQDERFIDTWPKREPQDGVIDWNKSCHHLYDWVRALSHPFPGAFTFFENKKLYIWKSQTAEPSRAGEPGQIISSDPVRGLEVVCGEGSLFLTRVRFEKSGEIDPGEIHAFFSDKLDRFMEF